VKTTSCVWCSEPCKAQDDYDDLRHKAVCSTGCKDAENMFLIHWCDKEINRRAHYRAMTTGEPDGQSED